MYDDIGLTPAQRALADSTFDAANCAISVAQRPLRATIDSIRLGARRKFRELLTSDQVAKLDARIRDDSTRRARADSTRRARGRPSNSKQDSCRR